MAPTCRALLPGRARSRSGLSSVEPLLDIVGLSVSEQARAGVAGATLDGLHATHQLFDARLHRAAVWIALFASA
jgi:hypothetical protein